MEMSNLRVESHIAQKSRRDKLRIQQNADPNQHLEEYNNNMEQFSVHHQVLGQAKYGSLSYDPNVFSSEMLSYVARNPQLLLPQNDALVTGEESGSAQFDRANGVSFEHLSHQIPSKVNVDPQNSTPWKSIGSQQSCDWVGNYSNGLAGVEQSHPNNFSSSSLYGKSSSFGYHQDLDSVSIAASEMSGHHRLHAQKHYGEIHYGSSPICQNNLQEVVPSVRESQRLEMASLAQPHMREGGNNSNELLLLPAYGDQSKTLQLNNDSRWINRSIGGCHPWNADSDFLANKSIRNPTIVSNDNCSTQGLSLSLSSVPQIESHTGRFGGRDDSQDLLSRAGALINDLPGSKSSKFDLLCNSHSKGFIGTKIVESTHQNTVGPSGLPRSTGPLGPFTGYATILKSSKYLKPTQQLLSESCYVSGQEPVQPCEVYSRKNPEDIGITVESMVRAKDGDSGASSSAIYGSNENISGEAGAGGRSSSSESHRPEIRQKKVKLIYMQEEICRRYKQYHQQMQMVVSSFESVAGLSSATPYISLALKAVTRHFRSLKNAITVQLRHTRKALGEDLSSPTTGTSSSKGDNAGTSRTRIFDHGFQKHYKSGGCFLEPQQPVWRPQRGLPERAVSVLRAWLFDHFLHPYPTDTDKHMLATQTGLTRNQVSNWFINARVRVWKPMVEEIHTLETKALEETNSNAGKVVRRPPSEGAIRLDNDELPTGRILSTNPTSNMQAECSRNNTVTLARMGGDEANPEFWNQEKRSRVECQIPASMGGSLLGFEPYQQGGIEIGRFGAVSLTLGLRQGAENAQQQQQQLQQHQEHQLRQQFGGHIIHDFVG